MRRGEVVRVTGGYGEQPQRALRRQSRDRGSAHRARCRLAGRGRHVSSVDVSGRCVSASDLRDDDGPRGSTTTATPYLIDRRFHGSHATRLPLRGVRCPWAGARCARPMCRWGNSPGAAPSSYDRSRTRGGAKSRPCPRLDRGEWPTAATISGVLGTRAAALTDAFRAHRGAPSSVPGTPASLAQGSAHATSNAGTAPRSATDDRDRTTDDVTLPPPVPQPTAATRRRRPRSRLRAQHGFRQQFRLDAVRGARRGDEGDERAPEELLGRCATRRRPARSGSRRPRAVRIETVAKAAVSAISTARFSCRSIGHAFPPDSVGLP